MTGTSENTRRMPALSPRLFLLAIIPLQFLCFYWWPAESHYFSGDGLYYFSRQIHSWSELAARLLSVDEMYQYRPLTYVVFSFVLFPLFGSNPSPYHLTAYLFSTVNAGLACACVYYWAGRKTQFSGFAAIFLVLNPVHFFPSFGPTYIDQWLSSFLYFLTLLIVIRGTPKIQILAPLTFLFALLSKEHSVMLPVHALVILWVLDTPVRDALRKTKNLWIVLAVFVTFQIFVRQGAVFAPADGNPNLQFSISAGRVLELARGAKPAIFYPENYLLDEEFVVGRWIRLTVLIPILTVIVIALKRRPRLAISALVWVAISLLPIAFLRQAPFPRHYYLGLPGLAILFACAVPSWRAMAAATPVLAFLTFTNVHLYARESWIAKGARQTKAYLESIQTMLGEGKRSAFYVINGGDPYFFWHIDGGNALPYVLGRDVTFRFAALKEPLPTDQWLNNGVNVILPREGNITDLVKTGQFPPAADREICAVVEEITRAQSACSVIFRGEPVLDVRTPLVETPNRLPIFEVPEGVVTLSRTAIRIPGDGGLHLNRTVRAVPESADGVVVEVYAQIGMAFEKRFAQSVAPGERRELSHFVPPGEADHVFIRIHPGADRNEERDWLIWER